ncbi:MAG: hypothetical protein ABF736_07910, partial [Liquorilactobacillus satsumensis]
MSSAQNVFLVVSVVALLSMGVMLLGLSWGLSFQAVLVGSVACFSVACLTTIAALILGVAKIIK